MVSEGHALKAQKKGGDILAVENSHKFEMATGSLFDAKTLSEFKKPHLVELVLELQKEKSLLANQLEEKTKLHDERITELERSHYLYLQYGRRSSIEITGIPEGVEQNKLEDEVMKIYKEAKVSVHGKTLDNMDIEACHRIGKKNVVICRFANRKWAREGLFKGKNLKGKDIYGRTGQVYINDSFCKPFQFIGFVVRKLRKRNIIEGYKIRNGVFNIKVNGEFVEIAHKHDFVKHDIDIETVLSL